MNLLIIFIALFFKNTYTLDICESQKTCEECIRQPFNCVWCTMDNVTDRCRANDSNLNDWCLDKTQRFSPPSRIRNIEQNVDFSSDIGHIIQIRPQKINLDLRPGAPVNFNFSFKNAQNYPVDLYFLIDGTPSMKPIKEKTASESENIYKMMKNMTNNVFLGMGVFVDKNALPFTQTKNSTITYSFKNRLKLTDKFEDFQNVVNDTPLGFSYDEQEGTLEALVQVMVCNNEIGWRRESRKIIVVLTGGSFHAAGDGKWAGIINPNDGKCYTKDGIYTKELEMDYPSISLINKLASEEQMTILFAVTQDRFNLYTSLSKAVSGSRVTIYSDESKENYSMGNILRLIYKEITSNLKISVNMKWSYQNLFKISTYPDCISSDNEECIIKAGEEKTIKVTMELMQYQHNIDNIPIDFVAEGIKEKLNVNVNIIKTCNCSIELNSEGCSQKGKKRCGICECNEGNWGDKCQCTFSNSTSLYDKTVCKAPNSTEDCNGHGICKCGTCICRDRFEGRYCECNKDSCPRGENNALCSDRGDCKCGKCKCDEGWTGDACTCMISSLPCRTGDKICNDRGTCNCGNCQCQPIAKWDARGEQDTHCVVLPCEKDPQSCHSSQCNILESCALCSRENTTECTTCNNFNVTVVKNITDSSLFLCQDIAVDVGCDMVFGYRYANDRYGIDMVVQSEINCAKTYYIVGGGVLGSILAIGIATICLWKCISDARDKREYNKFLDEIANPQTQCDNPIFKPTSSTFPNPLFRKRSIFYEYK